jgi:phytol kinase
MKLYLLVPLFLLYGIAATALIVWLKDKKKCSSLYTRKLFHILIFTTAGFVMLYLGTVALFLFGIIISGFILYAVFRSRTSSFYQALVRVSDKGKNKIYVILPLISTALGGAVSVWLFGKFSLIGFFVSGWGDGVAELAGSMKGAHKYRALSWGKDERFKTLEGSLALFLVSAVTVLAALLLMGVSGKIILEMIVLCSLIAVITEASSPSGVDNFTVQITVSAIAFLIFQRKI